MGKKLEKKFIKIQKKVIDLRFNSVCTQKKMVETRNLLRG